jgi:hypothetical protein
MTIQQCNNCNKKGKNVYCNNCIKSPDYFDVYKYNDDDRFDKGRLIGTIKAYTWNEAIKYIKNRFFSHRSKEDLIINCEKDFTYLEENRSKSAIITDNKVEENRFGYKIYLNKEENESSLVNDKDFWDITGDTSFTNNDSFTENVYSDTNRKQQQQQQL